MINYNLLESVTIEKCFLFVIDRNTEIEILKKFHKYTVSTLYHYIIKIHTDVLALHIQQLCFSHMTYFVSAEAKKKQLTDTLIKYLNIYFTSINMSRTSHKMDFALKDDSGI